MNLFNKYGVLIDYDCKKLSDKIYEDLKQFFKEHKDMSIQDVMMFERSISGSVSIAFSGTILKKQHQKKHPIAVPCSCGAKNSQIIKQIKYDYWTIYCNSCGTNNNEFNGKTKDEVINRWNGAQMSKMAEVMPMPRVKKIKENTDKFICYQCQTTYKELPQVLIKNGNKEYFVIQCTTCDFRNIRSIQYE